VFTGNQGSYGLLDQVGISCSATDDLSGVASTTCAETNGPAWSFGPGSHTLSASATDVAGNTAEASTSFTVTATPGDLCSLTFEFVEGSAGYARLSWFSKLVISARVRTACAAIESIAPNLSARRLALLVAVYDGALGVLQRGGTLTTDQVNVLRSFSATL
jgi:hypothetical protein